MDSFYKFPTVDKEGHLCSSTAPKYCCDVPGTFLPYFPDLIESDYTPVGFYIESYGELSIFAVVEKRVSSGELFWVVVLTNLRYVD